MILPEALVVHIQVTVHTQIKTATDETLEVAEKTPHTVQKLNCYTTEPDPLCISVTSS